MSFSILLRVGRLDRPFLELCVESLVRLEVESVVLLDGDVHLAEAAHLVLAGHLGGFLEDVDRCVLAGAGREGGHQKRRGAVNQKNLTVFKRVAVREHQSKHIPSEEAIYKSLGLT